MRSMLWLIMYFLRSIGLFTLARRRNLRKAWLSWVPGLNYSVQGGLSDQYQHMVKGRACAKGKALLILWIAVDVLRLVLWLHQFSNMLTAGPLFCMAGILGCMIAILILSYKALFDVYRSCCPKYAVTLLVVGFLSLGVLEPVFLFAVRNRDGGLPVPE